MKAVINEYDLTGTVQGVGFRPAVLRLAQDAGLAGWVQNRAGVVRLSLVGGEHEITEFIASLPDKLPANAHIENIVMISGRGVRDDECLDGDFVIIASETSETQEVLIPADLAVCDECRREVMDPGDRRHGYAFTTCTRCGPRYTVINAMPYDRERTTMKVFPLCADCAAEYEDQADRRFHAETIACPGCGPKLWVEDASGNRIDGDPIRLARKALQQGEIVAVRGIGGFLLAADALQHEPLRTLRVRKHRPHKPFAVMAPDMETLRKYCRVDDAVRDLLESPAAPIVIVDTDKTIPTLGRLSPDTHNLGVMLPTSPLHLLLFEPLGHDPVPRFELLLMTSGNRGGEPICISNQEARDRLRGIADLFLLHDREINLRNDDSLVAMHGDSPQVWRRARGYAPQPITLPGTLSASCLAMGAGLKNTVAFGYDDKIVISPHVGDLDTPEAVDGMRTATNSLLRFLGRRPERIAVDLHPDMHSTIFGRTLAGEMDVPVIAIQHHHAHAVAAMTEHGLDHALALVFDGTGLGADNTVWGAELMEVSANGFQRMGTFAGVPLPGGDAAVRQPVRQVVARLHAAGVSVDETDAARLGCTAGEAAIWRRQCESGVNAITTHAAGRVFDAWAALLGIAPGTVTYEGQAAIRLEAVARCMAEDDGLAGTALPVLVLDSRERDGKLVVDWSRAFLELYGAGTVDGKEKPAWALAFHHAMAQAAVAMVRYGIDNGRTDNVVLSGGVFMNRLLTRILVDRLTELGVNVFCHSKIPPNDGGVSLGQAVIGGGCAQMDT